MKHTKNDWLYHQMYVNSDVTPNALSLDKLLECTKPGRKSAFFILITCMVHEAPSYTYRSTTLSHTWPKKNHHEHKTIFDHPV